MGVDRQTFACYGVKIELVGQDTHEDDLDKFLAKRLRVREWGALSYGGDGGFILCDPKYSFTVSENGDPCSVIPLVGPEVKEKFFAAVHAAIDKGAPFRVMSTASWWVGMHTY